MADCDIDVKCVNALRCLAADMPTQANSGHPGAPLGCAPMAFVLFNKIMKFNPSNPDWFAFL
jgi:transketolase